jgi:hypothetical protein
MPHKPETADIKEEILKKHLKQTEGENCIDLFFAYKEAMSEYSSLVLQECVTKLQHEKEFNYDDNTRESRAIEVCISILKKKMEENK